MVMAGIRSAKTYVVREGKSKEIPSATTVKPGDLYTW